MCACSQITAGPLDFLRGLFTKKPKQEAASPRKESVHMRENPLYSHSPRPRAVSIDRSSPESASTGSSDDESPTHAKSESPRTPITADIGTQNPAFGVHRLKSSPTKISPKLQGGRVTKLTGHTRKHATTSQAQKPQRVTYFSPISGVPPVIPSEKPLRGGLRPALRNYSAH